jgi:hypothetical protein
MPNARRRDRTKRGADSKPGPSLDSGNRGASSPADAGGGRASPGLGQPDRGGAPIDTPGTIDTARIAQDFARAEALRKKREYSRAYKARIKAERVATSGGTNPTIDRESFLKPEPGVVTESSAVPPPDSFRIEEPSTPRKSYTRKPRVDPQDIQIIAESVKLIVNGIGNYFVGDEGAMSPAEEKQIVEPLTRLIQRMQPDTVKAIQTLSDPVVLVLGGVMYASRLASIRRDQGNRGPRRPSPPPAPSGPSEGQAVTDQRVVDNNGHLVDIEPITSEGAYTPRNVL